jgi:O-antigen/teichoic acid export membrane protein
MLGSRALRALVAAGYFTLLARSLGVSGYGAFAGICGLAGIAAPFASLGTGNVLIQEVARDRSAFPVRWGNCLMITGLTGTAFTLLILIAGRSVLPRSLSTFLILNITIADLLFVRLLDVSAMAFQALEKLHMTAWFSLALTLSRLTAAAVLCIATPRATAAQWSGLYLLSTAIPACLAVAAVSRLIGYPALHLKTNPREVLHGLLFSISLSAQTVYNDIDKTMLVRISGLGAAGLYGAAYRIMDAAFTPVGAVQAAAYGRFFQRGAHGLRDAKQLATRLLARAAAYSAGAGILLWLIAPILPAVLGAGFAEATFALRMLAPLLLFRSLHCFAADSLTGAGYQGTRTMAQVGVALLNVALNLVLLPHWSWRGAALSSLVCEALLAFLLWLAVWFFCSHERKTVSAAFQPEGMRGCGTSDEAA